MANSKRNKLKNPDIYKEELEDIDMSFDDLIESFIRDYGKSLSMKVTPNQRKYESPKKKGVSLERQKKLDNMASRGTPNEQKIAKKKQSGPSLPSF